MTIDYGSMIPCPWAQYWTKSLLSKEDLSTMLEVFEEIAGLRDENPLETLNALCEDEMEVGVNLELMPFNSFPARHHDSTADAMLKTENTLAALQKQEDAFNRFYQLFKETLGAIFWRRESVAEKLATAHRCIGLASLPDEILSLVFKFVGPIGSRDPDPDLRSKPSTEWQTTIHLASVCRRFRVIMLALSCRWNALYLQMTRHEGLVETFLERSGSLGVIVEVEFERRFRFGVCNDEDRQSNVLINKAASQMTSLRYKGQPQWLVSTLRAELGDKKPQECVKPFFPNLQVLALAYSNEEDFNAILSGGQQRQTTSVSYLMHHFAPRLRKVSISGDLLIPKLFPGVTELEYTRDGLTVNVFKALLTSLVNYKGLLSLTLDFDTIYESPMIFNDTLATSVWCITDFHLIINTSLRDDLFTCVQFPDVQVLTIDLRKGHCSDLQFGGKPSLDDTHSALMVSFLEKFFVPDSKQFPALTGLSISYENPRTGDFEKHTPMLLYGSFLRHCPVLKNLELSFYGDISEFTLPPALDTLTLSGCVLGDKTTSWVRDIVEIFEDEESGEKIPSKYRTASRFLSILSQNTVLSEASQAIFNPLSVESDSSPCSESASDSEEEPQTATLETIP